MSTPGERGRIANAKNRASLKNEVHAMLVELRSLSKRDPKFIEKYLAIQRKYNFGRRWMVKTNEANYGTRSDEFDEDGKHISRRKK